MSTPAVHQCLICGLEMKEPLPHHCPRCGTPAARFRLLVDRPPKPPAPPPPKESSGDGAG